MHLNLKSTAIAPGSPKAFLAKSLYSNICSASADFISRSIPAYDIIPTITYSAVTTRMPDSLKTYAWTRIPEPIIKFNKSTVVAAGVLSNADPEE